MRTMKRNQRGLYYANPVGTRELYDGEYHTGEYAVTYGIPLKARMNIGAESGTFGMVQYGMQPTTTRTLIPDNIHFPVTEQTVFWIDVPPTENYNYVVHSISKSLNSLKITVKRVIK